MLEGDPEKINIESSGEKGFDKTAKLKTFLEEAERNLEQSNEENQEQLNIKWAEEMLANQKDWNDFVEEVNKNNLLNKCPEVNNIIIEKAKELRKNFEDNPDEFSRGKYKQFLQSMKKLKTEL
jgi:hypothetical protein